MSSDVGAGEDRQAGARAAVAPLAGRARELAFATVLLAFILDIVDSTIVNVALPAIQRDLAAGDGAIQWVVAGYFLSFAVLLVLGGRLGDLYGYRRLFLVGVGGFTLASVACGAAASGEALVLARIAQGGAAAMMAPQVIAIVQLLFSPLERVGRLAAFGLVGGLAAILGPILGGLLIEADVAGLGWRAIFLVNGPIGVAALAAAWRLLPEGRSPHPLRLDSGGAALLALALGCLLVPLIDGRERGWPWWGLALLAAAPFCFGLLWRHARARVARLGSALIEPALFRERTFALGLAMTLLFSAAVTGFLLMLSLTLQHRLGYAPIDVALAHVPFGVGVMLGVATIGRRALPRYGRRVPLVGALVMAAGCVAAAAAIVAAATPALLAALAVAGVGMGCVTGPLGPITLARVDRGHAGVAGGTHSGVQQIGGALGAAGVGSLFFAASLWGGIAGAAALLGAVALIATRLPDAIFAEETEGRA